MAQDAVLSKHIISRAPTEITYIEWSVVFEDIDTKKPSISELGVRTGTIMPIYVKVGFQEINRLGCQHMDNDILYKPIVSRAQCIIG